MKYPNRLATRTERMHASVKLPKSLADYFNTQEKLTTLFRQVAIEFISQEAADSCQVVRYFDGELIVSTQNNTLVAHLHYLSQPLIDALKAHTNFSHLSKISLVHITNNKGLAQP